MSFGLLNDDDTNNQNFNVHFIVGIIIVLLIITGVVCSFLYKDFLVNERNKKNSADSSTASQSEDSSTQNEDLIEEDVESELIVSGGSVSSVVDTSSLSLENLQNSIVYTGKAIVYLTFDDGPSSNTNRILDILAKYKVKAAFFPNARSGAEFESLYNRIISEGHTLGNHTYSHITDKVYMSKDSFRTEVVSLSDFISGCTGGYKTNVFRFPGGSNTRKIPKGSPSINEFKAVLTELGYEYYDWNASSTDTALALMTTSDIVRNTLKNVKYNQTLEITVLFHDAPAKTTTPDALDIVIKDLLDSGYQFERLTRDTKPIHIK